MKAAELLQALSARGISLFTGVPDSLLAPFCAAIEAADVSHIPAPNEGAALSLAAGFSLAGRGKSCVYCQNSGLGNLYNPLCSLTHPAVYGIPVLLVVGWRGAPEGKPDEPQHAHQGAVTLQTLSLLDVPYAVLEADTSPTALHESLDRLFSVLSQGKTAALVVREGSFTHEAAQKPPSAYTLSREGAILQILAWIADTHSADTHSADALLAASTGKIARELYEGREARGETHTRDFLCVGAMGHCSSLALGIALAEPLRRVICLDGDGALLMHLGAMAMLGAQSPKNLIHILLDNGVHDTVGGMPVAAPKTDYCAVARACGYPYAESVSTAEELTRALERLSKQPQQLSFLRIAVSPGARANLGRPKSAPKEALAEFQTALELSPT